VADSLGAMRGGCGGGGKSGGQQKVPWHSNFPSVKPCQTVARPKMVISAR
jgi:hypothetical protein